MLVTLATHHDMLQRKMTLCNDKLRKLYSSIEGVTTEEQGWTMTELTMEFEQLDALYESLYRGFQEWLREFDVQKLKRENLETKSRTDRRDRASLMDQEDREEYYRNPDDEETTEEPGTKNDRQPRIP